MYRLLAGLGILVLEVSLLHDLDEPEDDFNFDCITFLLPLVEEVNSDICVKPFSPFSKLR